MQESCQRLASTMTLEEEVHLVVCHLLIFLYFTAGLRKKLQFSFYMVTF